MKQKIYNLLMVEHRGLLENCYRQVFFTDSDVSAVKTVKDYLNDFYLYLYEAKPKYIKDDVKGYYLQQVKDEKALPGWLHTTFRRFLLDENETLNKMQDTLKEYRQDLASSMNSRPIDLTLMHVAFAIAWFNQFESSEDKYLFFRSAYKHFKGFYSWPNTDLDDDDVARVLDIKPGNLRTRTSRLCAKVKKLVNELNDAQIATLNKHSVDIAKEIFETTNPDIESILERLLGDAERDLPQYDQIIALRKSKRESMEVFKNVQACVSAESESNKSSQGSIFGSIVNSFDISQKSIQKFEFIMEEDSICYNEICSADEDCDYSSSYEYEPTNSIVKKFMEFIKD